MNKFIILVSGMVLVTFIPRILPLILLGNKKLPEKVVCWLSFIPAAVLAALLAPTIILKDKSLFLSLENTALIVFIPTFIIAKLSKSIFYTVSGGLLFYILVSYIF